MLASALGGAVGVVPARVVGTAMGEAVLGAVALGVLDTLSANGREALGAVFGSLAGLSVFGIVQWLILRRVTRAVWWVLASVVGLVAAGPLGVGVLGLLVGDGSGFGAVYGATTGLRVVIAIARQPPTAPAA